MMKKLLKSIGLVLLTALVMVACSSQEKDSPLNLFPVRRGNVFSYIDPSGKIIINPQFKEATVFKNGLALVQTFGKKPGWGFITPKGDFAIKATYKEATVFSENLAWVVAENGAPEAINAQGEIKFKLPVAKSVRVFKNGMAAFCVKADSTHVKWGFVDKTGAIKIQTQFAAVSDFSEDKCAVQTATGEWSYINTEGKFITTSRYKTAKDFIDGKAIVASGNRWGVIDEKGNYVIKPQFSDMKADKNGFIIKANNQWGWCDEKGKTDIKPQFADAYPFNGHKLAPVKVGNKFGYINKKGKMIIAAQFDLAMPFNGKLAWVEQGHKGGFIDKDAKYQISPLYDSIAVDLKNYLQTGTSTFETVNSDYFDLDAIVKRIKNDITENTVAGMNFSTPMSYILRKYKKLETDFIRTASEHAIIKAERISNDATLDFFILGTPWNEKYSGNLTFNYTLKPHYQHSGFSYRIKLTGKAIGKEDLILKKLETDLKGYSKDTKHSNENVTILQSKKQLIIGLKESGIVIAAIYPVNAENLQMIDLNYGDGLESDSTVIESSSPHQ
jgi:hypothetical protein